MQALSITLLSTVPLEAFLLDGFHRSMWNSVQYSRESDPFSLFTAPLVCLFSLISSACVNSVLYSFFEFSSLSLFFSLSLPSPSSLLSLTNPFSAGISIVFHQIYVSSCPFL
ncbi:unnamed protein product [Rangifer tarandus platyrhynchus]|uniref:Uncharacterized protein n=2 Tax=Rangifer tarandus platyrhynchus TaxID=3082113 RepID=A0ABN8XNN4_RANTA|nr:unnamed protein product [Rangifer tarandus platyrhynchus]